MGDRLRWLGVALLLLLHGVSTHAGEVREIAPGIYLRPGDQEEFSRENRGHVANIGFIVGESRVAVLDTGSSYREGLALRRAIREVTDLPIAYVILTHMHPDHALGAAAFSQDQPVTIGHEQLADALARRQSVYLQRMEEILGRETTQGTRVVFPDRGVTSGDVVALDLGGRTLRLRAYPTAHTNNDLVVYDDKTETLWLSDLLFVERIPVVDGSLSGWLKVIDGFSRQYCAVDTAGPQQTDADCWRVQRAVPGHGPVVSRWKTALARERRYLQRLASDIRRLIAEGGEITRAAEQAAQSERDQWLLFDGYNGRNATAGYAELEWE